MNFGKTQKRGENYWMPARRELQGGAEVNGREGEWLKNDCMAEKSIGGQIAHFVHHGAHEISHVAHDAEHKAGHVVDQIGHGTEHAAHEVGHQADVVGDALKHAIDQIKHAEGDAESQAQALRRRPGDGAQGCR